MKKFFFDILLIKYFTLESFLIFLGFLAEILVTDQPSSIHFLAKKKPIKPVPPTIKIFGFLFKFIGTFETILTSFKNLNPQKFNYSHESDADSKHKGYVAQDLEDQFPEAYPKDPETDKYGFNPSGMVVYLMKAIQELEAKVAALEAA